MEETLNDYVDGALSASQREEVERHLAQCRACRATVEELRTLLRRAAALPPVQPSRDLFPAIRATATRRPRDWRRWGALAAVLVLGVGGLVAVALRGDLPWIGGKFAPSAGVGADSAGAWLAEYRAAERQYLEATGRLLDVLEERRGEIPPETLAVVEENLQIIDRAIGGARLAFETRGAEARDAHALTSLYHKKLQLLWRASRLTIEG